MAYTATISFKAHLLLIISGRGSLETFQRQFPVKSFLKENKNYSIIFLVTFTFHLSAILCEVPVKELFSG